MIGSQHNKIVTWAFGLCFLLALFAASRAQQLSGGGHVPCTTTALSVQYNAAGAFGCTTATWSAGNGNLLLPDGSATNPSIAFTNSTGTGLYRVATNTFGISVNGSLFASFDASALTTFGDMTVANGSFFNLSSTSGASGAGSGFADKNMNYQTPATGFTITLNNASMHTILNPAGTLASGTITMSASPKDGMVVNVRSTQIVTALTVSPNSGQSILGAPSSLAVGQIFECIYRTTGTTWYC